jgi:hypothetical protein
MHRIAVAVLCLSLSAMAAATPEETIIRNAYAKLSYAVDLETLYKATTANPEVSSADLAKNVNDNSLRFTLSNFVVGNFSDVMAKKLITVFPETPGDAMIDVASVQSKHEEDGKTTTMDAAMARWIPGPSGSWPDWTVAQMLPVLEKESGVSGLVRYCTFTVTVTLTGKSRTYQSVFFFSSDGRVAPGDVVVGLGGGPLHDFITKPAYPNVLIETPLWDRSPALRDYLLSRARSDNSCKSGDACCDNATLECGVLSADLIGRKP